MITVTVKMRDELTGNIVYRIIDGSILTVSDNSAPLGWESHKIGTDAQIKLNIKNWIEERANRQHNAKLALLTYTINS